MNVRIEPSWNRVLSGEWEAPYFKQLTDFVRQEYLTRQVFPPGRQIFAAFDAAPFEQVKVVILGQDPYHGVGQANGLCFSVNEGVPMPPSLLNIFKEVHDDVGAPIPQSGDLSRWARQGVLLLLRGEAGVDLDVEAAVVVRERDALHPQGQRDDADMGVTHRGAAPR